jgi:hypothetical protein
MIPQLCIIKKVKRSIWDAAVLQSPTDIFHTGSTTTANRRCRQTLETRSCAMFERAHRRDRPPSHGHGVVEGLDDVHGCWQSAEWAGSAGGSGASADRPCSKRMGAMVNACCCWSTSPTLAVRVHMISSNRSSLLMTSPMEGVVSFPDLVSAGGMVERLGDTDTKLSQDGELRR